MGVDRQSHTELSKLYACAGDTGTLVTFMPTRRSNVPCHCKLDTETIAQLFVSYSERVQQRKAAEDRIVYNNWVWSKVLNLNRVNRKFRNAGFRFHHEITTDGVAVSVLYSRELDTCSQRKGP